MAKRADADRFLAPLPSPIPTGKGRRSAAFDDRVLSDFLDVSVRVPDLSLPESGFLSRSPLGAPPVVDFHSIVSGDPVTVRRLLSAATGIGAVRVAGGGAALAEAVRAAIAVGRWVFASPEGEMTKGELGKRWSGLTGGIKEEFYWYRLRSQETEQLLRRTWPESYATLRDKMENLAARLETVAEGIAKILSQHVKSQAPSKRIAKVQSILCLRKHISNHGGKGMKDLTDAKFPPSNALSLHVSGCDQEFCIRHPGGSSKFMMPAGEILVTIGKPLQEWCNQGLKSAKAEALFQPEDVRSASFTFEYMCSPPVLSHEPDHEITTISLNDQLRVALVLILLYNLFFFIIE